MSAHVPALPLEADPLIAEAKQRARRRRLIALAALLAVGATIGGVLAFGSGGASGEVPWMPTRPQLGPANPPLAPACVASQLRGKLLLQGGGFGTLVGPLMIENRSSSPCALVGVPKLSIAGATSEWQVRRGPQDNPYDPLTPVPNSLRALAPGRWAASNLSWGNLCGRARAIVVAAPGGGTIALVRTPFFHEALCGSARAGSVLSASRLFPIVPQGPPSSALPLSARIVPTGRVHEPDGEMQRVLDARRGTWLSYTVVLTNHSAKPFSFGRSCPAYEEDVNTRAVAYVLNCHAIGAIAPHDAVRLAMQIFVPPYSHPNTLTWNLAPHSWGGGVADQMILAWR